MRSFFVLALLSMLSPPAHAVGTDDPPPNSSRSARDDFERGRAAIERQQWEAAIEAFTRVVQREQRNADAWNWLGYANRKAGKLDLAFKAYEKALAINPAHRGAHEYVGEAWLMANKPEKAEEHLATLARLCSASCEEYVDLQKALVAYRSARR